MKHFIYEDSKISVEMPIVRGITLIHGNSGTGKSYVCDRVRRAQSDPGIRRGVKSNVDIQKICVIQNRMELPALYQQTNKLVIIDRLDLLLLKEKEAYQYDRDMQLIEFINNSQNYFILMSRGRVSGIKTLGSAIFQIRTINNGAKQIIEVYRA